MTKKDLSIVVPCFNEQDSITVFYESLCSVIERDLPQDLNVELLFIDDGSSDSTLELLKGLYANDLRVRYLSFSRNFGKESAIYAGLKHARGKYVAIMDADMQDPPDMLPVLYGAVNSGKCDIARLRRTNRRGEPRIRSLFARAFYKMMNRISHTEVVDGARDYQLMNEKVAKAILSMSEYNRFFKGISGWVGFKTEWFEYENIERVAGETKWNFFSLFRYALDGIISFSSAPLVLISGGGMLCFLIAIVMILTVAIRALFFGDPVAGWPSTICIMLFLGGIQLLSLGVVGAYLAKTYLEVKRRPLYILSEQSNRDGE